MKSRFSADSTTKCSCHALRLRMVACTWFPFSRSILNLFVRPVSVLWIQVLQHLFASAYIFHRYSRPTHFASNNFPLPFISSDIAQDEHLQAYRGQQWTQWRPITGLVRLHRLSLHSPKHRRLGNIEQTNVHELFAQWTKRIAFISNKSIHGGIIYASSSTNTDPTVAGPISSCTDRYCRSTEWSAFTRDIWPAGS